MKNAIEISNLTFEYEKGKTVLDGMSLAIKDNSITAILGENGSGKSTLLDCIIGYNKSKQGKIEIFGKDRKLSSEKDLAKQIAYIPQDTIINIDYSVLEFILFGRTCYLGVGQSPDERDYELAKANAEKCGILSLLAKDINKISGGERQLAFIARALTQESKIIIMDEPTAALDFGNQRKVLGIIKELQRAGKTIVFTTHNPNYALLLDSDVCVIKNGQIFDQGKAKDIITVEKLKKIYGDDICESRELLYNEISFNIGKEQS